MSSMTFKNLQDFLIEDIFSSMRRHLRLSEKLVLHGAIFLATCVPTTLRDKL